MSGFNYNLTTTTIEVTGSLNVTTFGATGSLLGTASNNLTTASISGNDITFTKGDATTFVVTVPGGGSGGSQNLQDTTTIGNRTTSSVIIGDATSTATGLNAVAFGYGSVASGDYSFAQGSGSVAAGNFAVALGWETKAESLIVPGGDVRISHAEGYKSTAADGSHAEGSGTTAVGVYSHAEGINTTATGGQSHAEGDSTVASGDRSHTEGNQTTAAAANTHAEGSLSKALGVTSHAEGSTTTSIGSFSHSEGQNTTAVGIASHAAGFGTIATDYQTAIGAWNVDDSGTTPNYPGIKGYQPLMVGIGIDPLLGGTLRNAFTVYTISDDDFSGTPANGTITLPCYANLNFTSDANAGTAGVPLGGIYHNNGAVRIKIS